MMILYDSDARNMYTEAIPTNYEIRNEFISKPICSLPDTISGTVKRTISAEDILEFSYPSSGTNAHEIQLRRIIECKADPYRQTQYFRILSIDISIDGTMDVYAKHIVYDLRNMCTRNVTYNAAQPSIDDFQKYINEHLYYYLYESGGSGEQRVYESGAFRYTLSNDITLPSSEEFENTMGIDGFTDFADIIYSSTEGSVLSVLSGEIEFDRYNIIHKKNIGRKTGYSIEYGKNLTGFTYTSDTQRLYTDIMPYWKGTIKDTDGVIKENYIRYITDPDDTTVKHIKFYNYDMDLPAFKNDFTYGMMLSQKLIPIYYYDTQGNKKRFTYTKILPVDITEIYNGIYGIDSDGTPIKKPSREDVAICGMYYAIVNGLGKPSLSMSIDFVDLKKENSPFSEIYKLLLGDIITINNYIANVSGEAEVVSTTYNILTDQYESIELGDIAVSLAEILSDSGKKTYYNKIIRN